MSFLFPFFLIAGVFLAVPVLIHLFNLRKYKTVLFPHTRFLKNIQLNSQKQSQVRYKLLLAARLLFLAALILAFAQPFFNSNNNEKAAANKLQVIYLDNSYSMSVKKGARTVLDIAKDAARRQVKAAPPGSKFVLLTNDKPMSYRAEPADKVCAAINVLEISAASKTADQLLAITRGIMQNEGAARAALYYYSDFQKSAFPLQPDKGLLRDITFYGMAIQAGDASDIYIDTAFLTAPVLQTGKNNYLIVHTRLTGGRPKESPVLSLAINGQVKSAASLSFDNGNETTDTLSFQVENTNWQKIQLTVTDPGMRFDDTFRITARSSPGLSVLVLNEGQLNPYIQAAFRAYNGFRLNQVSIAAGPRQWRDYNLVILNGITRIDDALGKALNEALQQGRSVCIFPGKTNNFEAINNGLKQAGDIRITGLDTAMQAAGSLQQGSALVKDLFERIPENVQLPVATWHYSISAGLGANQQSVLSFRNGDPLLAVYTPSRGQLYIYASAADLQSGNFPGSYFFTPFLYQMAMQGGGSSIYAITAGGRQPVYLPLTDATERSIVHLYGIDGADVIPPQRPNGGGLDIYAADAVQQPAFYALAAPGGDTTIIAMNQDKRESQMEFRSIADLKSTWKGDNIKWQDLSGTGSISSTGNADDFPIWKICALIAVAMLVVETYLLARKERVAVIS